MDALTSGILPHAPKIQPLCSILWAFMELSKPFPDNILLAKSEFIVQPRQHSTGTLVKKLKAEGATVGSKVGMVVLGVPSGRYVDDTGIHLMAVVDQMNQPHKPPSYAELDSESQLTLAQLMIAHLCSGGDERKIVAFNEGYDLHMDPRGMLGIKKPSSRSEHPFHMHLVTEGMTPDYQYSEIPPRMDEPMRRPVTEYFHELLTQATVESKLYWAMSAHGSLTADIPLDPAPITPEYLQELLIHMDGAMHAAWHSTVSNGPHRELLKYDSSGMLIDEPRAGCDVNDPLAYPFRGPHWSVALTRDVRGLQISAQPHFYCHAGGMEALGISLIRTEDKEAKPMSHGVRERHDAYGNELLESVSTQKTAKGTIFVAS